MSSPRMRDRPTDHGLHLSVRFLHSDMYRLQLILVNLLAAALASPATSVAENQLFRQNSEGQLPDGGAFDLAKPCSCTGAKCQCCVNFNMTYVDLGGPGCVSMKYLSKEEGILVNVSYGDSQLHGEQIRGPQQSVTCMDILLDLAQMCARFTDMAVTDEGMRACAGLEPTLLGDPQDVYHLGCFIMGPQGMRLINSTSPPQEKPEPQQEPVKEGPTTKPDISEEALIAAVNESAEEGIAWFSSFLGLSFGKSGNETKTSEKVDSQSKT